MLGALGFAAPPPPHSHSHTNLEGPSTQRNRCYVPSTCRQWLLEPFAILSGYLDPCVSFLVKRLAEVAKLRGWFEAIPNLGQVPHGDLSSQGVALGKLENLTLSFKISSMLPVLKMMVQVSIH